MSYDALEVVKLRNNFYRDSYRKMIIALLLCLVVIGGLAYTVVYLLKTQPKPVYFAATDTGRLMPVIPLNQPNLEESAILRWASQATMSVYSFNFINFRQALQQNKKYFTAEGWQSFMQALQSSKNLQAVQSQKLVVSAIVDGAPIVRVKGLDTNGRYYWNVEIPTLVHYESSATLVNANYIVKIKIVRVSTLDNPYGIGIQSFNMVPYGQ